MRLGNAFKDGYDNKKNADKKLLLRFEDYILYEIFYQVNQTSFSIT